VFGLIDAKSTQEEARARLERSLFITLVSSGNAASFVSAIKEFGPVQTIRATDHPSWFRFWDWGQAYQPNMQPMHDWAVWRLRLCHTKAKDCSLADEARADLSSANLSGTDLSVVNLSRANLSYTDFSHAYLNDIDLSGADLSGASFRGASLRRANLKGANWSGADLSDADLFGANLTDALNLTHMQLVKACGIGATTPPGLTLKPCPIQ
jgi:hypothetical protein